MGKNIDRIITAYPSFQHLMETERFHSRSRLEFLDEESTGTAVQLFLSCRSMVTRVVSQIPPFVVGKPLSLPYSLSFFFLL